MDPVVEQAGRGWQLRLGPRRYRCALGRGGVVAAEDKREGDGATPAGRWPLRSLLYRADRVAAPATDLPMQAIALDDGWCDAPDDPLYNRLVTRPFAGSHERLWRRDHRYDLLLVLGYNDAPPRAGRGSAIFLHCAAPGFPPTAGCVALARRDLIEVLAALGPDSLLDIRLG